MVFDIEKKYIKSRKNKKKLLDKREKILNDSARSKTSRKPVELDQTSLGRLSRIDAIQLQAMALETNRRRSTELLNIDATLKRIEEGSFGICSACGEKIQIKRLEFDPTIKVCIDCAV